MPVSNFTLSLFSDMKKRAVSFYLRPVVWHYKVEWNEGHAYFNLGASCYSSRKIQPNLLYFFFNLLSHITDPPKVANLQSWLVDQASGITSDHKGRERELSLFLCCQKSNSTFPESSCWTHFLPKLGGPCYYIGSSDRPWFHSLWGEPASSDVHGKKRSKIIFFFFRKNC